MRAARFHRFGEPSVLDVEEVPWPAPKGDEVLIRVHGSSINGTDLNLRGGGLGLLMAGQLPFTPGFDVSGEVAGCGPAVTAYRPGDRVYALLGHGGGGAADYVTVSQARVGLAPDSVDLVTAAAVPLSGLTALQALRGEGHLQHSQDKKRVLVYGASGGIGAFAVQLARIMGAHVTGVARAVKLEYLRELGVDEALSTDELDWNDIGQPWDVILDTPPALKFSAVNHALTPHGVLVSTRGLPTRLSDAAAMLPGAAPRFAAVRTAERGLDLAFLSRLIDRGELKVPVDRVFALADIRAAHEYAEGPEVRGKVVLSLE
ncbi:NADP-dependent oxidoreductase [Deinococcus humi]|uniref:NADPH:quinone reductase-like Zn-dependent oxidoreductase n=1 Tax=Deinococcus humi TaxID=662880 RepID=A0A7W8JYN9_9DEIO|nr:NADP-dependent oxidoreductase [Deinococcus humi]MBB5365645.1 NADPH:quinone reductase-like Zn-dependent oxidoreductase [Deinococcus humi]GGO36911.1 oxidoreductase [Deinococcus humi]